MKGRQLAWMVNHFFRTNPSLDMVYRVEDLTRLQCAGDKDLHNFRHRWNMITGNMLDKLHDKTLEHMLVSTLATVKYLAEGLAHYYRQPEDSQDKSYQVLRTCIDRCLELRQQKQNRQDMTKVMQGQQPFSIVANSSSCCGREKEREIKSAEGSSQGGCRTHWRDRWPCGRGSCNSA